MFITRAQYNSSLAPEDILMGAATSDTLCTYGYIFFDYQKALYNDTNIASLMNIDNVITHFGADFVKSQLRFDLATLTRYADDDSDTYCEIAAAWDADSSSRTYSPAPYAISHKNTQELEGYAESQVEYGISGTPEYSRFIPRSFNELSSDGLGDYALSMFEFYDYQALETVYNDEWYKFDIQMQDYTLNAVNAISSSYAMMMTGSLKEYYDMAHEDCYYNDVDGNFNRFFIDGITSIYSDEQLSPWVRAPIIYNIHKDILTNEFAANVDEIIEISQEITDKISPETGTIEQLQAFYTKFEALWDYFYGEGGTIYELVYIGENADPILDSPQELLYSNTATDLPDMQVLSDIFALGEAAGLTYIMDSWAASASKEDLRSASTASDYGGEDHTIQGVKDRLQEIYEEFAGWTYEDSLSGFVIETVVQKYLDNIISQFPAVTWDTSSTGATGIYTQAAGQIMQIENIIDGYIAGDYTLTGTPSGGIDTAGTWKPLIEEFTMLLWPNGEYTGGSIPWVDIEALF